MNTILFRTSNSKAAKATVTRNKANSLTVQGYLKVERENGSLSWQKAEAYRIYPASRFDLAKKAAVIFAACLNMPTVDLVEDEYSRLIMAGIDFQQYMPE